MVQLFGYNPVIEIDWDDPIGQIEKILNNYSDYFSLIEKNYQTVIRDHKWEDRWKSIKQILKNS